MSNFNRTMQSIADTPCDVTRVLRAEELPPFELHDFDSHDTVIGQYMAKLIPDAPEGIDGASYLLPSMESLLHHLGVPLFSLQSGLRQLRHMGLDYFAPGLYGPITVWRRQKPAIGMDRPMSVFLARFE